MLIKDYKTRVSWLDENCFSESDGIQIAQETISEGAARLVIQLDNYSILFRKLEEKKFRYIKHSKCADTIIFERTANDQWVLHVIEFKRTVTIGEWAKIKEQFKGAILNAIALMGMLEIPELQDIKCYTAFRRNKLTINNSEDPVLFKTLVGEKTKSDGYFDWESGKIGFDILDAKEVQHIKAQLDQETGEGTLDLRKGSHI